MTLRYEQGKPVGLDWSVCTDGVKDDKIWWTPPKKKKKYKPRTRTRQLNRPDVKNPGVGRGHRRTPEAVAQEIVRLYRDDLVPSPQIAKRLGVARQTVYVVLDRYNVERRSKSVAMKMSRADRPANSKWESQDLQTL